MSEPVLPATEMFGKNARPSRSRNARWLVPLDVVVSIIAVNAAAVSGRIVRRRTARLGASYKTPEASATDSTSTGRRVSPRLATVPAIIAPSSGDKVVFQKPAAVRAKP